MHMKFSIAAVAMLLPVMAGAQTAPAPAATATVGKTAAYSTTDTDIGTLLDNPATKAVLVKDIPQIVNNDQIAMARGMTLKAIQQYAGDTLTDAALAKVDADLAAIPVKK